jgi:hypothetical protein
LAYPPEDRVLFVGGTRTPIRVAAFLNPHGGHGENGHKNESGDH